MAKHDKLTLNIAKAVRSSDYYVLKYSSTERGKVVDVTVKDTDNNPYDLTGLKISFVEELYNGNIVVDEDNFNINADDLKNGQFSYQFRDEVYQYDGWAHFKFTKNENLIDTTAGFAIRINFDIDDELDEKSYVVYFENIKKEHQTALNSLRELISSAQALNDSNHSEISIIKSNITDLSNRLNDQVDSLGQRITDVNNTLSGRVDTLNEATNNLKNADADLQSQINSKTTGTVVTAYDIASKTPTKETSSYTNKWLVDQNVLAPFADQINQLKGRRTVDAPDFNTLTDTGVYYITNPDKGKNFPLTTNWGILAVFSGSDARTTQLYVGDKSLSAFVRTSTDTTWSSWNQIAWTSDITNLQNTVNNKVNVTGHLYREIKNSSTWNDIFGVDNPNNVLTSLRIDDGGSGSLISNYAAGIGFGGADTKGVLSVNYMWPQARITAGNGDKPVWSEDIAWKSDITSLQNQIQSLQNQINDLKKSIGGTE